MSATADSNLLAIDAADPPAPRRHVRQEPLARHAGHDRPGVVCRHGAAFARRSRRRRHLAAGAGPAPPPAGSAPAASHRCAFSMSRHHLEFRATQGTHSSGKPVLVGSSAGSIEHGGGCRPRAGMQQTTSRTFPRGRAAGHDAQSQSSPTGRGVDLDAPVGAGRARRPAAEHDTSSPRITSPHVGRAGWTAASPP